MRSGGDEVMHSMGEAMASIERERLAALDRLDILDTPPEPLFDALAELAALSFNTPIALISLIDRERQWFKARIGLDVDHTERDISFCRHAILSDEVLAVRDALGDARFRDNPFVTGVRHIRFYAGAPLISPDGHRLGTICVLDTVARAFTDADAARLRAIAKSVMQAVLLRRDSRERERIAAVAERQTQLLELAEDMAGVGTWSWNVATDRTTWSDQVYRVHGYELGVEPPTLEGVLARYHPDDAQLLAAHVERAITEGVDYSLQARIYRPDGTERHITARGGCCKDAGGAVIALAGTFQDITAHVMSERFIRSLADNLPGPVGYWDADLRCRFANAAYQEWFGQTPETMLTLTLPEFLGPAGFAACEDHVRAALRGEKQCFLRKLVKPCGTISHTQTHYIPDTDTSGGTRGFHVLVSDITALKLAEEAMLSLAAQRETLIEELTTSNAERGRALELLGEREAELRLSSRRHIDLINAVDQYAIYLLDPNGNIASWSVGAQKLKGYEEAEIIGHSYATLFSASDRAAGVPESILATTLSHGKFFGEGWRIRKDGSAFWSEHSVEAIHAESGVLTGFVKVSRDVSERRELERSRDAAHDELKAKSNVWRETNRLLLMAEEVSLVGYWRLDVATNAVLWSDVVCAIHGRPAGYQPSLEGAIEHYHPDDRPAVQAQIDAAIRAGESFAFDARIVRPDGTVRHVMSRGRSDAGPGGTVVGMFGVVQDITEAKRQQQALAESEETFRRALENAVIGNALVAVDGRWLTVNHALCSLVGYPEHDLLDGGITLIQHPDDQWSLQETVTALMSDTSSVVGTERRLRHRDGRHLWVQVCASLVTRAGDAPDYLVVQFQDLTERKQAEIVKDEFVSTVNHELRTPLTAIFGSLRLLGATTAGKLDPKSERLLEVARISCTQLTGLVNDILDIEKIAAGKMDYHMATVDAAPLIQDIIDRHGTLADLYGVRFNTRLAVDGVTIRVDPNRFNQALVNLLSNAAKYSRPGDQVDIVATREGATAIRVSVTDHGPGIPDAFRPMIFGRFAQADNSTTRRAGGSGLGLNITKTLIEAFGGTVSYDSIEGQGATFHFVLPIHGTLDAEPELLAYA